MNHDGFVDISSGKPSGASGGRYKNGGDNKKTKKAIIIAGIAVAAVAVLGVAGFFIFNALNKPAPKDENAPFTFTDKTVISGVDVTGMTLEQAKQVLNQNTKKFNKPIEISVDISGTQKTLNQDNFTYTYNIDQVLQQAYKDANDPEKKVKKDEGRSYTITSTVQEKSINDNAAAIEKEVDKDPVDAYVSKFHPYSENRFEYVDEENGRDLNGDDLKKKLKNAFAAGGNFCKVEAIVEEKPAEVTTTFLKNNIVKLATYSTVSTNTENGTTNMRVALEATNGSIINPGDDIWSFNDCTGDSNQESNGYKSAHVISEGKLIDGIGGGICQASSTIYNAAIRANLEIEERYCHQWASVYVPTGLDATIDYPNLDLKLSNPSKTQVFLESEVDGTTLEATFWGVKYGDYDEITTHNEISDTGSDSYSVRAWRIYLKNGNEIDREELPKSTYDMDYGVSFISADYDAGVNYEKQTNSASSSNDNGNDDDGGGDDSEDADSSETPQSSDSGGSSQSQESSQESSQSEASQESQEEPAGTE